MAADRWGCQCPEPKVEDYCCRTCYQCAVTAADQPVYEDVLNDLIPSYGDDDMPYLHDLAVGVVALIRRHQEPLRSENERLREALSEVEYLGRRAQSPAAVHMEMVARAALSGSSQREVER